MTGTPLFRRGRPLKRWRYVGVFSEQAMACAATVQVGPARQSFWAVLDRRDGQLVERTHLLPRSVALDLSPGRLRIREKDVLIDLRIEERDGIEARCPSGELEVWTRKQAGLAASGTISLRAHPPIEIDGMTVIDDTAGYHQRVTEWRWAAGVGGAPDGSALAFNLVEGVNDPPTGSERAIWLDGVAHEPPPVRFAADLSTIAAGDGSLLRFAPEAERARRDNLLLVRSDYRAPFGSFSGTLPGGIAVEHALGVVEHHRARW